MSGEQRNFIKQCSACGSAARRMGAKFCAVCGHDLSADYAPLDSLKASYNLRRKSQSIKTPTFDKISARPIVSPAKLDPQELFAESKNGAASTAMACVVYSLVPYLGILFCPGALILGGIGLAASYQKPHLGGRETAAYSLLFGALVTGIQILLWWLLYAIPEFRRF